MNSSNWQYNQKLQQPLPPPLSFDQFQQKTQHQQQLNHQLQQQYPQQAAYTASHPYQSQQQSQLPPPQTPHYNHQGQSNSNVTAAAANPYSNAGGVAGYYPIGHASSQQVGLSPIPLGRQSIGPGQFAHTRSSSSPQMKTTTPTTVINSIGISPVPVGFEVRNGTFTSTPGFTSNNEAEGGGSSSGGVGPSPLRRGQACQACRKRKLRCDAVKPICGTCTRSRKAAASANHVSPIPDGDCVYDDIPSFSSQSQSQQTSKARRASNIVVGSVSSSGRNSTLDSSNSLMTSSPSNLIASSRSAQKRRKTMDEGQQPFSLPWNRTEEHAEIRQGSRETSEQRTQRLESRIHQLENLVKRLQYNGNEGGSSSSYDNDEVSPSSSINKRYQQDRDLGKEKRRRTFNQGGPAVPIFSMLSPSSGKEEKYRMQYSQRPAQHPQQISTSSALKNELSKEDTEVAATNAALDEHLQNNSTFDFSGIEIDRDEQIRQELRSNQFTRNDPILQLLWPGWSAELPSPDTVLTMCETFFRLHPMRNLVYKPSFMSGLSLPSKHPHRPHDSLIHAILATTADLSPFYQRGDSNNQVQDRFVMMLSDARFRDSSSSSASKGRTNPPTSFKEFHLRKAREKVEYSLITDFRNPLDWISACLLSGFTLWSDYRITETYFLAAILCRAASPAGIDKLPSRHFNTSDDDDDDEGYTPTAPGLFGTPQGVEEHERRMTLWHIFIMDQYAGGPISIYENLLSESSILTNLPCSVSGFQSGLDLPPNNQTLCSPDLFRCGHLDDFTLHIKSSILVRRACTLQCRNQLTKKKPNGLNTLDKQITEFINSFPSFDYDDNYLDNNNKDQQFIISSDKYMAWSNISLALFHLHEPYLAATTSITVKSDDEDYDDDDDDTNNPGTPTSNYSAIRINQAIEKVLETIHHLMNSSFDFTLLHPGIYNVWSVCGRMLGKDLDVLKRKGGEGLKKKNKKQQKKYQSDMNGVMEKLQWIILALERGGEKNIKARRCSELVGYVRSGTLHESILSQLLYTDGVIPTGEEENTSGIPSVEAENDTSLDVLMMSAASNSSDTDPSPQVADFHSQIFPGGSGEPHAEQNNPQQSFHQPMPGNDMLLNFAL